MRIDENKQSSKPIRDSAYETLRHAIISGDIPSGSRIVETDYAQRLHISRTPLREALRKLERDGLLEYLPRRGVMVRAFTMEDVDEIYIIRNTLEMQTLPAIVKNATAEDIAMLRGILAQMDPLDAQGDIESVSPLAREFHTRLTAISGLKRIILAIEGQDEYIRYFSAMAIAKEERRSDAHHEHHLLVDYVEQHDLERFSALMKHHIERSRLACLAAMRDTGRYRE